MKEQQLPAAGSDRKRKEHRIYAYRTKTVTVCLGALISCALWGSAFPCIKIGYRLFAVGADDAAAQIVFAGLRFTLAGILAILIGSLAARRLLLPKKESCSNILKLSLVQTVAQYLFFYVGLANTTGVKASIIGGTNVFMAILAASLLFRQERLTVRKMAGSAVGFAGVVLVNLSAGRWELDFRLLGEGFILLSTAAYACSTVLIKKYSQNEEPVVLSGWQFLTGGIIMTVCGLAAGGRLWEVSGAGIAMLIYLAFVSAAAYSVWGLLLKYNPVSKVAVFGLMNPVFGVVLSACLLGEAQQLGVRHIAALVLVCIGIYVVDRKSVV